MLSGVFSGDIISRITNDVGEFMNFIHWNVFYTIGGMLNLILSIGFICYLNRWIGIFTIILTPVIVYLSRRFSGAVKKYYEDASKERGLLSSWLFEIISGMQDIRLLNASRNIVTDYVGKTIKIMRLQIKSGRIEVVSERVNSGVSLMAHLILYGVSAVFIVNGHFTVGGFTACIAYFGTCIRVFNTLNDRILNIAANMTAIDRVVELLEWEDEEDDPSAPDIVIEEGDIRFTGVSFAYDGGNNVLDGVNLHIGSGEKVALVGYSGAGKTTIANLIYRLYQACDGRILIDGKDIAAYNLLSLRRQIGIVHQETLFFDDTIRFNLSFSHDGGQDEAIWQALRRAHLEEFVKSLPLGLDTVISSKGGNFSGGQRQRLAIARIFVHNPRILIFDEATSSLDSEAEQVITSSWDEICRGRTIIVIAHRLSTILNSDRVAVLSGGRIAGYGKHEDLLTECSVYRELFLKQYGYNEVAMDA